MSITQSRLPARVYEFSTDTLIQADPIAMGECNGVGSSCWTAGFALESKCHLGQTILYDTVEKLGWTSNVRSHQLRVVIDGLLTKDWDKITDGNKTESLTSVPSISSVVLNTLIDQLYWLFIAISHTLGTSSGQAVPSAKPQDPCEDCSAWTFS